VYTNSIRSLGALQLLEISLEYDRLYGTWLPGYWTLQQIYFRYIIHIDGNSDIFISRGWYSEVYALYFISILYDCALMSTHFSLHLFLVGLHSVHRMSTFSHGFSCIWNVYL